MADYLDDLRHMAAGRLARPCVAGSQTERELFEKNNTPGVEWAAGDERTRKRARALQRFETVRLDGEEAAAAAKAIADAAASRKWLVLRAR